MREVPFVIISSMHGCMHAYGLVVLITNSGRYVRYEALHLYKHVDTIRELIVITSILSRIRGPKIHPRGLDTFNTLYQVALY